MSNYVKTSITLTKEDKKFIDSNLLSLSKIIRHTINEKRNDQAVTRKSKLLALSNHPAKGDSK